MTSWECHRCKAVNAPHVNQCSCNRWAGIGEATPVTAPTNTVMCTCPKNGWFATVPPPPCPVHAHWTTYTLDTCAAAPQTYATTTIVGPMRCTHGTGTTCSNCPEPA